MQSMKELFSSAQMHTNLYELRKQHRMLYVGPGVSDVVIIDSAGSAMTPHNAAPSTWQICDTSINTKHCAPCQAFPSQGYGLGIRPL